MRKKIIASVPHEPENPQPVWLSLDELATVEVTSEDPSYPIESALLPDGKTGWRADSPGEQIIRLVFDSPQHIRRIFLNFSGDGVQRTQEFVLRWSRESGRSFEDIVRQQWNFSPDDTVGETEDYHVDLPSVTVLELKINPDISGANVPASLARMRLA